MTPDNHRHVTLMSSSFQPPLPSLYAHPCSVHPNLTLASAWGDVGEFVARPFVMKGSVAVVELLMLQPDHWLATRRKSSPSPFLNLFNTCSKTGRPRLHLPSTNLWEIILVHIVDVVKFDNFHIFTCRVFFSLVPPLKVQSTKGLI